MAFDLITRGGLVVLPEAVTAADIGIAGGSIVEIGLELPGSAIEEINAKGLHIFPGVVDTHVHFNEPGRADWEGAATGSAALAAGGGTCFCDMPLNSSPTTIYAASFDLKRAALEAASCVDFGLWGGLGPHNHTCLPELAERGVIGFKAFMCSSGIDDFPAVDDDALGRGMEIAAQLGLPVAVHAEDEAIVSELASIARTAGRMQVRDFLASRPLRAEVAAIERAVRLAEQTHCSLHIVHVSSGAGVAAVAAARARGLDVTCETCPHYLVLTDEDVERIGAAAKCAPPIRSTAQREALWTALIHGDIQFLASDHSPAPWSLKQWPDFFQIWGGIAGCQTTLGLLLTEGHVGRGLALSQIAHWLCQAPADRYRLPGKGRIAVGMDADLALVDLRATSELHEGDLRYRHRISPYIGRTLVGSVRRTLVRGHTVFAGGPAIRSQRGKLVRPPA